MVNLSEIIEKSGLHKYKIQNVYLFGSQCYGTSSDKSDYDILIIAKTPYPEVEKVVDNFNIHILTIDRFLEGLKQHNIRNLECLMAPDFAKLKEDINIPIDINILGLRHSISHTCSNSWVKCAKKIQQGDYYIGIKSIFHSLRISMFGIQIANHNKIIDWQCANYIWKELSNKTWTWEELDKNYRPLRNKLMTQFRNSASKI